MANTKLPELKCKHCKATWTPRKPANEIIQCPRCTSKNWNGKKK